MVARKLAFVGDLRRLGLQLLQAHHVRAFALQPLAELRRSCANAVDVPGRDFHSCSAAGSRGPTPTTQILAATSIVPAASIRLARQAATRRIGITYLDPSTPAPSPSRSPRISAASGPIPPSAVPRPVGSP